MPRIFITAKIPDAGVALLQTQGYEVEFGDLKKAKGADALLCLLTDMVDGKVMDAIGSQLKIIANYATGTDNIDLKAATQRGIAVTNTPDVLTEAVAEHTVALILGISRHIAKADQFMKSGKYRGWDPDLFIGMELAGKTFGLIGHGRIGCRVAAILQNGFSMNVLYYDVVRDEQREQQCRISHAPLEEVLSKADVVSVHVPLLPTTRHLLKDQEFKHMKPTSYLINTSRGPILDEKALVHALQEHWIQGAGLDVFEEEPKLAPGLAKLDNVLLTPHIASATKEARTRMAEVAALNIIAVLSGKPPLNQAR